MGIYFFSSQRAEKTYFTMSPAECMLLAVLFRSEETAPVASLSIQIVQIVQNSLPAAVKVRNGSRFWLSV